MDKITPSPSSHGDEIHAPATNPNNSTPLSALAISRRLSQSQLVPNNRVSADLQSDSNAQQPIFSSSTTVTDVQSTSAIDIARRFKHKLLLTDDEESHELHTPEKIQSTNSNDSSSSPYQTNTSDSDNSPYSSSEGNETEASFDLFPFSIEITKPSLTDSHTPTNTSRKDSIELTEIQLDTLSSEVVHTRQRAQQNKISTPLEIFLQQMNISLDAFEQSELAMLEVILAPKTWKQKLPSYLRLPLTSDLIAKVLFYMMVHKKDLASTEARSSLSEKELSAGFLRHGRAIPIPLDNKQAFIRAYQITGFSNAVSWVGGVWLLLYLSLQVNAFILAIKNGQTDYKFSDIFLEPYNLYQLFTDAGNSTKASLTNSLSSYAVWPFLIGIPLLGGIFSSWRYGKMAQQNTQNTDQAHLDLLKMEQYTSNLWLDHLRWYIPNHPMSGPLNRLRMNLLFNANESIERRSQAFDALTRFLAKAKGHTQLRAREVMAALAFSISPADLIKAKQIFPDADYTQVIKTMGKAYFNLIGAAFSLKPKDNESYLDAVLRAGKTRKLSHNQQLGHAGNLLLLFILYDLYISYSDVSLSLIILKGIIKAFKNLDDMVKCKQADKVWAWRKESKTYECSVCGDEDQLAYSDIWSQESCVTAFLGRPQPAQAIVNFFNNHNLQGITSLDFSAQLNAGWTPFHNANELDTIFSIINQRTPMIVNFTFSGNGHGLLLDTFPDSSYAGAPLGRFIANAKQLKIADLSNLYLQANGTIALAPYLNQTQLTSLNLSGNILGDMGINAMIDVLPQLPLESLNLMYSENSDYTVKSLVKACLSIPSLVDVTYGASYTTDASAEWVSQLFLKPGLRSLFIYSYFYTDVAIMFYAARMAQAKNLTKFDIQYYSMTNESTIHALSDSLTQTPIQQLRMHGFSSNPTVPGLDYFFYRLKDTSINILELGGSTCPDEASTEAFSTYFPLSQVQQLSINYCTNPTLSANATAQFASGLYKSNISSLFIGSMSLSSNLDTNFQQVMLAPQLESLELTYNFFDESLIYALINQLPDSQLHTLRIYTNNGVNDNAVNKVADLLSQTKLSTIRFGGANISQLAVEHLFDKATQPGSSIKSFEIFESQLGDDGASYIASRLPSTSLNNLFLGTSKIGDRGASKIAQALVQYTRPNLLWLDLISQADFTTIEPATQLRSLNLAGNSISAIGAQAVFENLHYTNIPPSDTYLDGDNLTIAELSAISMTSSASRQATIPWPIHFSYVLLVTIPHQLLSSASQLITNREHSYGSATDSCRDIISSLLMMLLAYKLIFSPLKQKLERASRLGFFDTRTKNTPSSSEGNNNITFAH
jgi:Ran GTPase-activating protein (RanGAP) involved in mRNA processing and transport